MSTANADLLLQASRWSALDRLRALITVLVVVHHALLAWHPFAPPARGAWSFPPTLWQAFPIVDRERAPGVEWIVGINDNFFMALMFLIGGWFVVGNVQRGGARAFLTSRALRLGLPFILAAGLLAPLAYYPSYLQNAGLPGLSAYWQAWQRLLDWPAGPAWFLAVLFAFSVLAALALHWLRCLPAQLAVAGHWLLVAPWRLALGLVVVALLGYLPLAQMTDPLSWSAWGPFTVQTARPLLYFGFFIVGMALGATGPVAHALLASEGALARRWWGWLALAAAAYGLHAYFATTVMTAWFSGGTPIGWQVWAMNGGYALACAFLSLACMALVARFARHHNAAWRSLSNNAYVIYLLHYVVVVWLQYALLGTSALPAWGKAAIACMGGLALSWLLAAGLRRVPGVTRVV